jgi:hypothetical protein
MRKRQVKKQILIGSTFMSRFLIITAAFALSVHFANAQLISNPNPPVPAALGVGGAYTAVASGAEAPYWNPSGLAYGKGTGGRMSYHRPYGATFLTHLSASGYTSLSAKAGALAIGIQTLGTRSGGQTMASENELFISHGFLLQQDIHTSLAFGYTLKMIGYDLGTSVAGESGEIDLGNAITAGLDVGATAQVWDRFRLAGAFRNINHPQMGADRPRDLPRILSAGVSYFPYYGVRTSFDIERELNAATIFKGGIDAQVVKPFHLRFGVMTNPNIFTGGFGLFWREIVIDYAFIYHPVLSPSHMIGIGFDVDQPIAEIWHRK